MAPRLATVVLERELKLHADASFAMPDLTAVPGVTAAVGPPQQLVAIYYDTPGLRLAQWGVTLRRRDDVWTLKVPVGDGHRVLSRHEVTFPGAGTSPPPEALDAVGALLMGERLAAVAAITTTRRVHRLAAADGQALAALADDVVEVRRDDASIAHFRELELELGPEAKPRLRKAVARLLREAGARREAAQPKLVQALGVDAEAGPEPRSLAVNGGADLRTAVQAALAGAVRRLLGYEPGVRLDLDTEAVHQARAATRQLRSLLGGLLPVLAEVDRAAALRRDLDWLGGRLGAVRDADVLADRLRRAGAFILPAPDGPGVQSLLDALAEERGAARAELVAALHEERCAMLIRDLIALAIGPDVVEGAARARDSLPGLVHRRWRRLTRAIAGLPAAPGDPDLHRIRIRAKDCRYLTEAAAPVLGRPAERLATALAEVQDVLGQVQDGVVAEAWLRRRGRRMTGARALAAGQLIAISRDDAAAARYAWHDAWSEAVARARALGLKAEP